jgi:hypothetical protein
MSENSQMMKCYPIFLNSVEGFETVATAYDNNTVYNVGDTVVAPDGITYKMIDRIGSAGYPPPRPNNWEVVGSSAAAPYDNGKVYAVGDRVIDLDNNIYIMIDAIGVAGYAPPRPSNWKLEGPSAVPNSNVKAVPLGPGGVQPITIAPDVVPMIYSDPVLPNTVLPNTVLPNTVLPNTVLPGPVLPNSTIAGSVNASSNNSTTEEVVEKTWIKGIPNMYIMIGAGVFLLLLLILKK